MLTFQLSTIGLTHTNGLEGAHRPLSKALRSPLRNRPRFRFRRRPRMFRSLAARLRWARQDTYPLARLVVRRQGMDTRTRTRGLCHQGQGLRHLR